jgi:uncharacterized protein YjbI with pentapeptide repeats
MRAKASAMTGTAPQLQKPSPELQARFRAHQCWIETNGEAGERLSLEGFVFEGLDLRAISFRFAELACTNWVDCALDECDYSHADLEGALFRDCSLTRACFDEAILGDCQFRGGRQCLDGASFENALTMGVFAPTIFSDQEAAEHRALLKRSDLGPQPER